MKSRAILLFITTASLIFPACSSQQIFPEDGGRGAIRIKGSDTMLHLVEQWAEQYMTEHPSIPISVEGGGSGTGFEALIEGDVHLCSASRTMNADEVKALLDKQGSLGYRVLTARDALSVYLHPENPVRSLSLSQLRGLFGGTITNWKEVGGADLPVVVITRLPNSGTYHFFFEHVLDGKSYSESSVSAASTAVVVKKVHDEPGAIGYGGLAYGPDLRHCRIGGVEATAENVRNGSYPISRYLYFYASKPPGTVLQSFIDWVLGERGQSVVADVGYIPLWEFEAK